MGSKTRVVENSILYIFSSLLVKAVGFLLLPVFTYFLTPEDYGIINLVNNFINVAIYIVAFSLYAAVIRFFTDYKNDKHKLKSLYSTVITFLLFANAVFLIIGFVYRDQLVSVFFKGVSFYPIVFIAFISISFLSLHTMHQSILQGMQMGRKITLINITVFGLTIIMKLIFIGALRLGALGFLVAQLIIYSAYFIYVLIDLKRNDFFSFGINLKILKETLTYSIPLMPHNLSTHLANLASRVFINKSGTLASVGLYSIAMHFGGLIDTIQSSVNNAFQPWFFEMMNQQDDQSRKEVVDLSNALLVGYSLIYMSIGLFSQEMVILMTNERYLMSWTVIPILVLVYSVKSIYYFYVNIIFFHKEAARKLFIATVAGSFMEIVLAYLVVPFFGMYGAAIAFLIGKIIIITIIVFISRKYNDVGYRVIKMIGIILPSFLFMGVGLYFSYTKYMTVFRWDNFFYKIIVFIVYIGFIYIVHRTMINKMIKSGKIQKIIKDKLKKKHNR